MKTKKIYIAGMHCASCEKLLDSEFRKIAGIANIKINRADDSADIYYSDIQPHISEFQKIGKKYDYRISEQRLAKISGSHTAWEWFWSISIALILLGLYKIFQNLGLFKGIAIGSKNISFGIAVLAGVVASLSSCLAVVGTVVIAFAEKYQTRGSDFYQTALKPNLQFHLGRLITFFLLGGVLGLLGGEINISGNFISIFTIIIAVVMAWLGLNILGILPSITDVGIKMPSVLTKNWHSLQQSEHKAAPYLLGGLTFFLPCGFTQSMQIFALASGSFLTGGLTLVLFALGTLPILMVVGTTASWAKSRRIEIVKKAAGILVVIFAISTFLSGYSLLGVKSGVVSSSDDKQTAAEDKPIAGEQIVEMHVTASGFEPSILKVKKGVPVKWRIYGDDLTGCTNKIIIKSLNVKAELDSGENIVRFTAPEKAGTLNFSCWMGMVRGKFIVE
ncbi:hypothetical protein CO019_01475 [Candidatus Berkelbacteria bacterium CG_4_9_14_0_2_um_filter_42_30]|uniref:HMA domain-containing protein n=5 Tax=Candidatus Berkelbacteria TaxID=1618330 RepID=A0A2H0B193_9BACT|nr:MAG: hypothetical protein AUJ40_00180 [Candidatus Berkelbacteria bacterium CG1_02_42_45]PIP50688.1 MAG: hypothetical protein COX11_02830 [Candidatus Berkelbacteria bacterium CG23_combo_of_CG06-09_8_20_14_all_41_73]PIR27133.1 MAG: hypothetical protein COV40_02480 [Candidatus Berkelbacteria bacterium CG11_big_fil_rev_8_21_14_0_20_42_15]PJC65668.1 MAG: hypothetical protein CO019_01475 [Candidatus Berkelbacteria bacterium CG_4_9_14_0_2_um_filter_42_30]